MENETNGPTRTLVIPGEVLGEGNLKAGKNTFRHKNKIYAAQMGFKTVNSNFVNVIPLGGRYIPKPDDLVIGVIQQVSPSTWLVDINSPYPAPLHVNEVPWRVDFGDTARYLNAGNTILARIFIVDEVKRIQVTMKDQGSRKLSGGHLIEISPTKVPRIIGKGGSMISMIKQKTQCRVFVGQNGRIWIDGEPDNIRIAMNAIQFIQDKSHKFGLTEAVERYLDETISGKGNGPGKEAGPAIAPAGETPTNRPAPREQPVAPSPVAPTTVPPTASPAPSEVPKSAPTAPVPTPAPSVPEPVPAPAPAPRDQSVTRPLFRQDEKPVPQPDRPETGIASRPADAAFRPPRERTNVQSGQANAQPPPVAPPIQTETQGTPADGDQKKQVLRNEEFERMSD